MGGSIIKSKTGVAAALAALVLAALVGWYEMPVRQTDLGLLAKRLEAGEVAAVVLELTAVLQLEPDTGEAHLLLGRALMQAGDAAAAEPEFARAVSAGVAIDKVAAPQSSALLALGKDQELITRFANVMPAELDSAAELQTNLAQAHAKVGEVEKSQAALAVALRLAPSFAPAMLFKARQAAAAGDAQAAITLVDGVIGRDPRKAPAWVLKGDLLRSAAATAGGSAGARDAYRKALELDPRQLATQVALLNLLLQAGDDEAARAQWAQMAKAFPEHAQTLYFDALLALRSGDAARAGDAAQRLLNGGDGSVAMWVLAGRAESLLGHLAQAEAHLRRAVAMAPEAAPPRHHLAAVLLQQGQPQRAQEVLEPLLAADSKDVTALGLSARAQLALGEFTRADQAFSRAAKSSPDDTDPKAARVAWSANKVLPDEGPGGLQVLTAADQASSAELATISARLGRKEFDQALKAVDALGEKQPTSPVADELRGQIALLRNDRAQARQHFEAALRKDARHTASAQRLALLDLADNNLAAAKGRFESLLERDAQNVLALVNLADLVRRTSTNTKDLTDLLDKAVQTHPINPALRLVAIDQLSKATLHDAALQAAQAAVAAVPGDVSILDRLATLQLASGDRDRALTNLQKLTTLQPRSAAAQLRLADALRQQGSVDEADERVRAAIKLDAESTPAQLAAIGLAVRQGLPGKALELAKALQTRLPEEALGFTAAGDIEAGRGKWDAANAAYGLALKKRNPASAAAGFHLSLVKAGRGGEAAAFEQAWRKAHPNDTGYLLFLAERAGNASDVAQAEAHLRRVMDIAPADAGAANALARLLLKQRQPGAKALAERAVALAPESAAFRDTLASILAEGNEFGQAIEVQSAAVKLAPADGAIRLNLAKLHLRSGDKDKARGELNRVAKLGAAFAGQAEVAGLLKDLGPAPGGRSIDTPAPSGLRAPAAPAAADVGPLELAALGALAIGAATAGVLLMAALRPPSFKLERSVVIAAPGWQVFEALQDFRLWQAWSPWPQFGPGPTRQFTGATAGLHHRCRWSTDDRRMSGSVEIMQMLAPTKVLIEWNEERPALVHRLHELSLLATEAGSTMVQWSASGPAPFGSRLKGLLLNRDGRLAQQLAEALDALKQGVESGRLTGAARIDAHAAAAPVA